MHQTARYIAAGLLSLLALIAFNLSPTHLGNFPSTIKNPLPDDAEYSLGRVERIIEEGTRDYGDGISAPFQTLEVISLTGEERNQTHQIDFGSNGIAISDFQKVHEGQYVVLAKALQANEPTYYLTDSWRLSPILAVALLFLALAVLFGGRRGALAVLGCALGVWILITFLVPAIINGSDPFLASITATIAIAAVSILVSHGFKRRTLIALASTILTLIIAAGLAKLFVNMANLTGAGTEEAFFLQFGTLGSLNIKGLLLAGIMIGVLGVLDDVTTAQAAVVEELKHANPNFKFEDLYVRGLSIGSEHIASLVNTLVLAYAGASFPLFLLFTAARTQPLWVILNSESVAEEIIRALIGSAALVLAVPLTTALAALAYHDHIPKSSHPHVH